MVINIISRFAHILISTVLLLKLFSNVRILIHFITHYQSYGTYVEILIVLCRKENVQDYSCKTALLCSRGLFKSIYTMKDGHDFFVIKLYIHTIN